MHQLDCRFAHRNFQVKFLHVGQLDLLRMVEPLDLGHHVAVVRLPEQLDAPDVGPVDARRREKDCAVADVYDLGRVVGAALDGAVEELLGLPLAARAAVALVSVHPLPQRPACHRVDSGLRFDAARTRRLRENGANEES